MGETRGDRAQVYHFILYGESATAELMAQKMEQRLFLPMLSCAIQIDVYGKFEGSLNGIAIAILDALRSTGIIVSTEFACVHWLRVQYIKASDSWIEIVISG